ncbi:MAG: transcriptional regulator with PAS, ATPase and Fis domain [Myxococcota bacterium]|jgi:transcriptional regulator with PAS, ATPase and Fis domain
MPETTSVINEGGRARRLHLHRLGLRVTSGPDEGLALEFDREVVRIGALQDNDVVLTDATVSRVHAELRRTPEGLLLRDLGSTNGSFVGDVRVREVYVGDRRPFRVGKTEIRVAVLDEIVEIVPAESIRFEGLVGQSIAMREVFSVLDRVAPTGLTVLVTGETGTGKELVSRAIHQRSSRSKGPFVVFDCGAVPRSLVESELFGHARGAFTGAVQARAGVFEQAHGGTIFIDELGELPLELQPVLLRVLEQREVRRVGERQVRPVDVRVVAATNRKLRELVAQGAFREDLYYRLAVVEVPLPPLRDRPEDLELLVEHLLANAGFPHRIEGVSTEVAEVLRSYRWPGNVRELRNILLRTLPFADGSRIGLADLPDTLKAAGRGRTEAPTSGLALPGGDLSLKEARERIIQSFEQHYLEDLLERCDGNVSRAAREAGVDRKTVTRMLKRHGIRP